MEFFENGTCISEYKQQLINRVTTKECSLAMEYTPFRNCTEYQSVITEHEAFRKKHPPTL